MTQGNSRIPATPRSRLEDRSFDKTIAFRLDEHQNTQLAAAVRGRSSRVESYLESRPSIAFLSTRGVTSHVDLAILRFG